MVNWRSKKLGDFLIVANSIVLVILINVLATKRFFRLDLTEEKRYSIKDQTRDILHDLEEDVYVEVFLEGELNPGFKRFRKSIEETLEEFRIYSGNKVRYTFTNPTAAKGQKAQSEFMASLAARGIQPTNVNYKKNGERVQNIIFPGALISYSGFETGVMLLKGNKAVSSEEVINQSIEGIEYELANAIQKLSNQQRKRIGFVTGHGELDSVNIASFNNDLLESYDVFKVALSGRSVLSKYDLLIISKPVRAFSTLDKFNLDQYIMQGGKVLFLIDKLEASMEGASQENYLSIPYELNLDDQLFKYGVRINPDLIQDVNAALHPIVTGQVDGKPQVEFMEWPFYPILNHYADHAITRNLDAVVLKFVNSIDTVKAEGVTKKPLAFTSVNTKKITAPVPVNVNELRRNAKAEEMKGGEFAVGYLLEGTFTSLFKNRFLPEGADSSNFKSQSVDTKLIVIADGDIVRNEINPRTKQPQPLGFDIVTNYTFANRDFLLNAIAFLTQDNGLIQARTKEIKIRPLDREKLVSEKVKWQLINLVLPVLVLIIYGVARAYWRRRKFAQF
jgi:ABC-2 type transport system permease protein